MCVPLSPSLRSRNEQSTLLTGSEATDFNAAQAWRLLTDEQRETARHSTVTYAPHALCVSLSPLELCLYKLERKLTSARRRSSWIASTKFTSDGSSIVTEGKEVPLDDLPPWEHSKLKTMPMVWYSPLDGTPSLMIHGQCAMRVQIKRSVDDEVRVLDDLAEVRAFLQECVPIPQSSRAAQLSV